MCKSYLFTVTLLCFCCFYSCKNTNNFLEKPIKIEGSIIPFDGCFIGVPGELICSYPYLMIYDGSDKKLMSTIHLENHQCLRFLPEGKGPNEVLPPLRLSVFGEKLFIYQINAGILNVYRVSDVNPITDELPALKSIRYDDRPAVIRPLGLNHYVGIGAFEEGRFHIYDSVGNCIIKSGKYPFSGDYMAPMTRFIAYQSYIASNPNGNQFVLGSAYGDNLEFYTFENDDVRLIKKYETTDVMLRGGNELADACLLGYKGAWGSSEYCYLLYSGKTFLENNRRKSWGSRYILVFDWNGEFIKSYEPNVEILSFCVDEIRGSIYAIVHHEDEFGIMQFDLL